MATITRHDDEIQNNLRRWERKPALRRIYHEFHALIAEHLARLPQGQIVELGSGIGNIRQVIPNCIRTDLFPNPWIDQVENAYRLSFADDSVSDLILFDVFHHLRYPGTALAEFRRVLLPGGRAIVFDPCLSLLGFLVYGLLHDEPLGARDETQWFAPDGWKPEDIDYYTAQANASKIFLGREFASRLSRWPVRIKTRLAAISYVASGGYSKPQLYPDFAFPLMRAVDRLADRAPALFATRLLVVLEKK